MAEVFLCPTGALTRQTVKALRKAGVVVVEAEQPERCQFLRSSEILGSNDLLWAALKALQFQTPYSDRMSAEFTRIMFELIDAARVNSWPPDAPHEAQAC